MSGLSQQSCWQRAAECRREGLWCWDPATDLVQLDSIGATLLGFERPSPRRASARLDDASTTEPSSVALEQLVIDGDLSAARRFLQLALGTGKRLDGRLRVWRAGATGNTATGNSDDIVALRVCGQRHQDKQQQTVVGTLSLDPQGALSQQSLPHKHWPMETMDVGRIGLWNWDTITDHVYFSDECKRVLEVPTEAVWDSFAHWESRLHPDDQAETFRNLADYVENQTEEYSATYRLLTESGQYRWMMARGRFIPEPDGQRRRISGVMIDITDQKSREQRLEYLTDELTRSNEELQQFAYIASHDLQEPLRAVAAFCQLLQQRYAEQLDARAQEYIGFAVDGAQRMQAMIMSLLDYSRVGSHTAQFADCDMQAICDQAIGNLVKPIQEARAKVEVASPLPTVHGDAMLLVRLIQNLLSNAIKFRSPDRPPQIQIRCQRRADCWDFVVRDNGVGFDPRMAADVFTIFRRLHHREQFAGTGIGLAIAKRIVTTHGGIMWAESEPGEGSSFWFSLPHRDEG